MSDGIHNRRRMFVFDQEERLIVRSLDGHKTWIYPNDAHLLTYLLENRGLVASKTDIALAVWGSTNAENVDRSIRQSIHMLRRILGKDSITTQLGAGYRLAETVEISFQSDLVGTKAPKEVGQARIRGHVVFATSEALLFSIGATLPIFLETAYEIQSFSFHASIVSIPVAFGSFVAAWFSLWLIRTTVNGYSPYVGLLYGISTTAVGIIICLVIAFQILPTDPITKTALPQSQTAQAAYAKNIVFYLLPIYVVFVLVPYWNVIQKSLSRIGHPLSVTETEFRGLTGTLVLVCVFIVYSILSIFASFYLLDNLASSENQNLFSLLLLFRNFTYCLIAIVGICWFYLNEGNSGPTKTLDG